MRSEALFTRSYGASAIFLPSEAENTTFAIRRGSENGTFGPLRKKIIFQLI